MTPEQRKERIERYAAGFDQVAEALAGFPEDRLSARPFEGKWSAREIVHHLADSETTSAIRLRKLVAEDHPVIQGYDQDEWARRLRYNERDDIAPSLEAFRAARATTLGLLRTMSEQEWTRPGFHTGAGPYTAETWLEIYARHAHGHAEQIRRLKAALTGSAARA